MLPPLLKNFPEKYRKVIDKFLRRVYNVCINHEGGVAVVMSQFSCYFYYFAKGCPSFVSFDA